MRKVIICRWNEINLKDDDSKRSRNLCEIEMRPTYDLSWNAWSNWASRNRPSVDNWWRDHIHPFDSEYRKCLWWRYISFNVVSCAQPHWVCHNGLLTSVVPHCERHTLTNGIDSRWETLISAYVESALFWFRRAIKAEWPLEKKKKKNPHRSPLLSVALSHARTFDPAKLIALFPARLLAY